MKCKNCGTENLDESKFCINCGGVIDDNVQESNNDFEDIQEIQANETETNDSNSFFCSCGTKLTNTNPFCYVCGKPVNENNNIKKEKPIYIAVILMVILTLLIIIMMVVKQNYVESVSLGDYISIKFEGSDGEGTAVFSFDNDKFLKDWNGKIEYRSTDDLSNDMDGAEYIIQQITDKFHIDKDSNLSTGEHIVVTLDSDTEKQLEDVLKCNIIFDQNDFIVTNLFEKMNIFEGVKLDYEGYENYGTVKLKNSKYLGDNYEIKIYSSDKYLGLINTEGLDIKNGTSVILKIDSNDYKEITDECKKKYNKVPEKNSSEEFIVQNLLKPVSFDVKEYFEENVKPDEEEKYNKTGRLNVEIDNGTYIIENNGYLKNGDNVNVQFQYSKLKGKLPINTEFEYTIPKNTFEIFDAVDVFSKNVTAQNDYNINKMGRLNFPDNYTVEPNINLQNGQKVHVICSVTDDEFDYTIPNSFFTKTEEIDLFADVELLYDDEKHTVSNLELKTKLEDFEYIMSSEEGEIIDIDNYNLKNGDKVIVHAFLTEESLEAINKFGNSQEDSDYQYDYGYFDIQEYYRECISDEEIAISDINEYCYQKKSKKLPVAYSKEYTIKLDSFYAFKLSDIADTELQQLVEKGKETVKESYIYDLNNIYDSLQFDDFEYIFFVSDDNEIGYNENSLIILYKITADMGSDYQNKKMETKWIYVTIENIIVNNEGSYLGPDYSDALYQQSYFDNLNILKQSIKDEMINNNMKEAS